MHWDYATLYPAPHNYVTPALADFYKTQPLKRFYYCRTRDARQLRHALVV